ncbi:unnamed protein product [Caenorhabditis brenneri]
MSKSQIKRLHQQQELEKSATLEEEIEESEPVQRKGPANRFAFFDDNDEDENEETGDQSNEEDQEVAPSNTSEKAKKNKTKKNKKKAKKATEKEESDQTMLARLAAVNLKEAKQQANRANDGLVPSLEKLMKIDIKMFDMSAEIKRKLGKAFKDVATPEEQNENRWPPGRRAIGRIVKNKPRWFPDKDCGLTMVEAERKKNIIWFKLEHNKAYSTREEMLLTAEKNMDVGFIQELFAENPYHLNVLMLLANMSRMNDELNSAADLIERGIWYVDQHAASSFEPFNWNHRMDYLDYENRAFYLLLHRHMLNAANKRCFETALNTAKMIFKLDPANDPLAIIAIIDVYALKAKQYQWVIDVYEETKGFKQSHLLPNWPYSVALAKFFLAKSDEDREEAKRLLCAAIRHFPSVVVRIMDLLQIHPDSAVMNCKMLTSFVADNEKESLKLIMKIYTKQTEEIWKVPETLLFLEEATRKVATSTDEKEIAECEEWREKRNKMYHFRSPQIDRFAQLLEEIPCRSLTNPMPPKNSRDKYALASGTTYIRRLTNNGALVTFLTSLLPYFDGEHSIQDEFLAYGEQFVEFLNNNAQNARDFFQRWVVRREEIDREREANMIHLDEEVLNLLERDDDEEERHPEEQ